MINLSYNIKEARVAPEKRTLLSSASLSSSRVLTNKEVVMKKCTKCQEEKSLSEFNKHPAGKFGASSKCKACDNSYAAERRKKLPPEYSIWTGMRCRCNNVNCDGYKKYGAKGITVCREKGRQVDGSGEFGRGTQKAGGPE